MNVSVGTAYKVLSEKMEGWFHSSVAILPNLIVAVVVVGLFSLASRLAGRVLLNILKKTSNNEAVNRFMASMVSLGIFLAGIFVALGILNLDKTVTSLLAGAGIISLAIGFAFQDIASNFIAGVFIAIRRPFSVGEIIETNKYYGRVEKINLRNTLVHTSQGQVVVIPNKDVFQNALINYSNTRMRRVEVTAGVAYDEDLDRVKILVVEALKKIPYLNKDKSVDFYYKEFSLGTITFEVFLWVEMERPTDFLQGRSDAILIIKNTLQAAGVRMPYSKDFAVPQVVSQAVSQNELVKNEIKG